MTQFLLSLLDNVSENPGCESFALNHEEGFDSNANIKEAQKIYRPSCD